MFPPCFTAPEQPCPATVRRRCGEVSNRPPTHIVAAIATAICFRHSDRQTGRSCTRCGRPACSDCLHQADVGSHCTECVAAAQPAASERLRMWNAGAGALVTKAIIAVNIAVFLLVAVDSQGLDGGGSLEGRLVLFGPSVSGGDWYRLVTSGFVHYGLLHIGLNMYTLYRFGEMMEPALGRVRMVALYLASLVAGSFGALLVTPLAFTAGASGAVFGLLGASAIGLHQRGIDVWRSGVGPLIAINLVITFLVPGISVGGHVGGLLGGVVVGSVMLKEAPTRRSTLEGVAMAGVVALACVAGAVWAAGR